MQELEAKGLPNHPRAAKRVPKETSPRWGILHLWEFGALIPGINLYPWHALRTALRKPP